MDQPIGIYGSGGFGREVAWLAQDCSSPGQEYRVVSFIDDDPKMQGQILNDIPTMSLPDFRSRHPDASIALAIGNPGLRQRLAERVEEAKISFVSLIHPRVERSQFIRYGTGSVICAGCILTTNITISDQVQINLDCTIGHDCILDSYTTLAPGVHVSGWVHFGKRVYVGTGAVIINGTMESPLCIGNDAVIGAGACVTKSVEANTTVVGVPARPLKK